MNKDLQMINTDYNNEVTTDMVKYYFFDGEDVDFNESISNLTQVFNSLFRENTKLRSQFIKDISSDITLCFINADCNIHEPSGWHCEECCDCRTKGQLKEWDWPIGCRYDHE